MADPIFISPIFTEYILPFVLVFTLIFAILQKTKLLGEGKKQIDAMIGLVVGLILIGFPSARDLIVQLMPFLAISAVVLLVFMLLYGFAAGKEKDILGHKWLKVAFGIIIGLALITALLFATGKWDSIYNFMFDQPQGAQVLINVLLIIVIAGAVIAVVATKNSESGESS